MGLGPARVDRDPALELVPGELLGGGLDIDRLRAPTATVESKTTMPSSTRLVDQPGPQVPRGRVPGWQAAGSGAAVSLAVLTQRS
jgi:hypothetical protein